MSTTAFNFFCGAVLIACLLWQFRKRISDAAVEHQRISAIVLTLLLWLVAAAFFLSFTPNSSPCDMHFDEPQETSIFDRYH